MGEEMKAFGNRRVLRPQLRRNLNMKKMKKKRVTKSFEVKRACIALAVL